MIGEHRATRPGEILGRPCLRNIPPSPDCGLLSLFLAATVIGLVTMMVPAADLGSFNLMMSVAQIVAASLSFPNLGLLRFAREDFTLGGVIGEVVATRVTLHVVLLLLVGPVIWLSFPWVAQAMAVSPSVYPLLLVALLVISLGEMGAITAQVEGRAA